MVPVFAPQYRKHVCYDFKVLRAVASSATIHGASFAPALRARLAFLAPANRLRTASPAVVAPPECQCAPILRRPARSARSQATAVQTADSAIVVRAIVPLAKAVHFWQRARWEVRDHRAPPIPSTPSLARRSDWIRGRPPAG